MLRYLQLCVFLLTSPSAFRTFAAIPFEIVLVDSKAVTAAFVKQAKTDGFKGVAILLEPSTPAATHKDLAKRISDGGLQRYYWIEVGRNPEIAAKNPQWMAALGSHQDWQKNFPKFPEPGAGEVAKAFPWVPIAYQEAFDAHLVRIEQLLKRVPDDFQGLLLNDLQAGPSSCGCGNLQCRWAMDYFVPETTTKLKGDDIAARFLAEVRKRAPGKQVIPVWTTECAEVDLPSDKHDGKPGTGFCGKVGCAHSACAEVFSAQWTALTTGQTTPVALFAAHSALLRTQPNYGGGPAWFTNAISYINQTLPEHKGKPAPASSLWVVTDGIEKSDETKARQVAESSGLAGIVVSRIKLDQSYEPRMLKAR